MMSFSVSKQDFRTHIRNTSILGCLYSKNQIHFMYNRNIRVNLGTIRKIIHWQSKAENILTEIVNNFYYNKNEYHKKKMMTIETCDNEIYPQLVARLNYEILETLWINYLFSKIQKQFLKKNKKSKNFLSMILCNLSIM